jgi:hypothetical protein
MSKIFVRNLNLVSTADDPRWIKKAKFDQTSKPVSGLTILLAYHLRWLAPYAFTLSYKEKNDLFQTRPL